MTKLLKVLVAVALVASLCGTARANLLSNGDFELGDCGQLGSVTIDNWTTWGTNGWHASDAGYYKGCKSIKFWWDSTGIYQDFAATVGNEYELSIDAISPASAALQGFDGILKVEWFDASWSNLGGTIVDRFIGEKDDKGIAGDGTEVWVELSGTATAVEGAAYGRLVFYLEQADNWESSTNGVLYVDDASVVLVPEPATMLLFGLGGLFFAGRRK